MHPLFTESIKSPFAKSHLENVVINVVVNVTTTVTKLTVDTDESYTLNIEPDTEKVIRTGANWNSIWHSDNIFLQDKAMYEVNQLLDTLAQDKTF